MYSVLNTLSEYTYFYISKTLLHTLLLLVSKIAENLRCILNLVNNLTPLGLWQLKTVLSEGCMKFKCFLEDIQAF